MNKTKIDWCDSTWNPVTGCLHECRYCYARMIAERFGLPYAPKLGDPGMEGAGKLDSPVGLDTMLELEKPYRKYGQGKVEPYPMGFEPTFHRYRLGEYQNKAGRNIFVCSMADLFGSWVPDYWIKEVFEACDKAPQHNYLFLTKNPSRYSDLDNARKLPIKKNMWYGVSVTTIEQLKNFRNYTADLEGDTRIFLSIEPILEDITENETWKKPCMKHYMDWVIIGAETGRRKDKVIPKREWIENIVNYCKEADIPVFMKSSLVDIWGEPLIREFPDGLKYEL